MRFARGLPRWSRSRRPDRPWVFPWSDRGRPERTLPLRPLGVTRRGSDGYRPARQAISNANSVAPGASHTCALLSGGAVRCWGQGSSRQLGGQWLMSSGSPIAVSGISTAIPRIVGRSPCLVIAIAVLEDGQVELLFNDLVESIFEQSLGDLTQKPNQRPRVRVCSTRALAPVSAQITALRRRENALSLASLLQRFDSRYFLRR